MSLPTQTNIKTMDYSYAGSPFVYVSAKSSVILKSMDWSVDGSPFVSNDDPVITGWTHKINGINNSRIGKINGISKTNISKVNGI